jgi:hypothetical protein
MRISIGIRTLTLAGLALAVSQVGFAQKGELTIDGSSVVEGAVPGQMLDVFVRGIIWQPGPPIPFDRFQVLVTQDGVTRHAKVRSAAFGLMNPRVQLKSPSSPAEKIPDISEQLAGAKPYQVVTFTAPLDLHEGDAVVVVNYRERLTNGFTFKVVNRLPAPRIGVGIEVAMTSSEVTPPNPDDVKQGAKRGLRLERGRDAELSVHPLLDPEIPESGVVVTFKQGSLTKDVNAKVVRRGGTESDGSTVIFAPVRYQVVVHAPEELELGAAHIEVRLKLRGQLSEPGSAEGLIIDSSGIAGSADVFKPHVTNMGERRIGIGQAITVSIDAKWLEPDPSKALIVLEQGPKRVELKPEVNSAAVRTRLTGRTPPILIARDEDGDLTGYVTVRVYNPARGDRDGLSEGTPIEIVDEVVPPLGISVSEAAKQDIALLRALHAEALKQGRDHHEYDPDARYVTIRAIGLDYNRHYVRVKFEQEGRQFILKYEDFSLSIEDRLVVRVPDAIKPGSVQLTIQNKGANGLSDPVIATVEITQPSKK